MAIAPFFGGFLFEGHSMTFLFKLKSSLPVFMGLCHLFAAHHAMGIDTQQTKSNSDTYEEVTLNIDPEVAVRGKAVWDANCSRCHDNNVPRAPHRFTLEQLVPETILGAMTVGPMQELAKHLTADEKIAVAEFVTRRKLDPMDAMQAGQWCEAPEMQFDFGATPQLHNWGFDAASTHYIGPELAKLTAEELPSLEVDWVFAYPTATRARSQPAIAGGAIFVGSHKGIVYSFDLETGCARWKYQARSEVRNAIVIEPWTPGDKTAAPKLFFGDITGNQYALNAVTGELVWTRRMDDHPGAQLTAASALIGDTLYVPISSLEEGSAISPSYPCCSFRGAIVAMDPATGEEHWRTHFIPPAKPVGVNSAGTPIFGPAGVPVWAGLAFDGDLILVATGDDYTEPASTSSDSIIALDRATQGMWCGPIRLAMETFGTAPAKKLKNTIVPRTTGLTGITVQAPW